MTGIGVLLVRTSASVVWVHCNRARNSMTASTPRLNKGLPMIATRDNRRFIELVLPTERTQLSSPEIQARFFDDPASLRALR